MKRPLSKNELAIFEFCVVELVIHDRGGETALSDGADTGIPRVDPTQQILGGGG